MERTIIPSLVSVEIQRAQALSKQTSEQALAIQVRKEVTRQLAGLTQQIEDLKEDNDTMRDILKNKTEYKCCAECCKYVPKITNGEHSSYCSTTCWANDC